MNMKSCVQNLSAKKILMLERLDPVMRLVKKLRYLVVRGIVGVLAVIESLASSKLF